MTFLENAGGKDALATFRIDVPCRGRYALYSYQNVRSKYLDSKVCFEICRGDKLCRHLYDRDNFEVFGQMRGDWYPLGEYDFEVGVPSSVSIVTDEHSGATRADAVLLIRVE